MRRWIKTELLQFLSGAKRRWAATKAYATNAVSIATNVAKYASVVERSITTDCKSVGLRPT